VKVPVVIIGNHRGDARSVMLGIQNHWAGLNQELAFAVRMAENIAGSGPSDWMNGSTFEKL